MRARVLRDVGHGVPRPSPRRVAAVVLSGVAVAGLALAGAIRWNMREHTARLPVREPSSTVVRSEANGQARAFAGTVTPGEGAQWSRTDEGPAEKVKLDDGTLRVHVRHLGSTEAFLVELPDGSLEVWGTTFRVAVKGGKTREVVVEEGVVALRLRGLEDVIIRAGETWNPAPDPVVQASGKPAASKLRPAASPEPSLRSSPRVVEAAPEDEGARDYAAAVGLWQTGQYPKAAVALRAFVAAHPKAPQLEDATFLEAAALARAGRADAAALAAEDHLARFPESFHRREAAVLVARAARDRGDCAAARAVLAPWTAAVLERDVGDSLGKCADGDGPNKR